MQNTHSRRQTFHQYPYLSYHGVCEQTQIADLFILLHLQKYGTRDKIQASELGLLSSAKPCPLLKCKQLIKHSHNNTFQLRRVSMSKYRFRCVQHPLCQRVIVVGTHLTHSRVVDAHLTHSTSQRCGHTLSTQYNTVLYIHTLHTVQHSAVDTHSLYNTTEWVRTRKAVSAVVPRVVLDCLIVLSHPP